MKEKFLGRFKKKTTISTIGCWLYTGRLTPKGYARVTWSNKREMLHRLSLHFHYNFDLSSKLLALHKCRNRHCWNPEHLYSGTDADNARDQLLDGSHHLAFKTHCKNGHPLDSSYKSYDRSKDRRYCRVCREERVKKWRSKVKSENASAKFNR